MREEVNDAVRAATQRVREARDDREAAMLDAQEERHVPETSGGARVSRGRGRRQDQETGAGWRLRAGARRSRAGAFVFWRENRRALETTKSRSDSPTETRPQPLHAM